MVRLANLYDLFFMKNKAIDTMATALKQPFPVREISSAYIYTGLLYLDMKKYKEASDNFHKGLSIIEQQEFHYSPNFNKIIKVFIKNGELEKATYWLNNLNKRMSYDKNFSRIGNINSYLKKEK